ncbi:nucleotide-binding universal stress UspA family protein [Pseudonocardia hierapolitana]|uniref:Nucleotide-binding universal stress UspA family protein n=1 Tax=Pseudonocardia hierapolitana TaxID=1128676 RepID=A0A561T045_9PSEU|nr:universal stress protein [Pseudonocardia hierapolitana]TWF80467.1 nucleotide-binding universal stress UspA family protein [Pseudonocardia hierapolitana]
MKPDEARGPVVVGVDHVGSASDAVDWAAAEAATRGCPLRIVHAIHPLLPADPYGVGSPIESLVMAGAAARSVLQGHAARARCVASDLEVTTRLLCGSATWALLDEASRARLLVMGSRGLHGLRALLARSVSVRVAACAPCPVVVVRAERAEDRSGASPRVVVGVHCDSACSPAIGFAFQAAQQRGVPLAAVHAWDPDPPADLEAVHAPSTMAEAAARRTLERALQRWHARYPDVPVVTRLVRGDPARAVAAESRGAALVVVGSRGRGRLTGTVRGSVSQAVLRHGRGPIAVVRHGLGHSSTRRARYGFGAATGR